jgi:hypothetical protein
MRPLAEEIAGAQRALAAELAEATSSPQALRRFRRKAAHEEAQWATWERLARQRRRGAETLPSGTGDLEWSPLRESEDHREGRPGVRTGGK